MKIRKSVLASFIAATCWTSAAWAQKGSQSMEDCTGMGMGMGMGMKGSAQHSAMSTPFMKEMMSSMAAMHKSMMSASKMNGVADHDFLTMMVHHHNGALVMSETYLKYSKDEKVKNFALGIIEAQKKEIDQMEAWIKEGVGAKK